ncbi:MAG: hypothetical protein EBR20_05760 [Bacteroidetes bacterium]|nr:hypothetical protein [Bacteroidota bacterium]
MPTHEIHQLLRPLRDELPLERLEEEDEPELRAPDEREELPLERLTPDEREELPVERLTPEERVELPVGRLTPEDRDGVLEVRPTDEPVRDVPRDGTALLPLPLVRLVRVVARLPDALRVVRVPTDERVVRVAERSHPDVRDVDPEVPTLLRVVFRVLPTVVRADRSPVNVPRDGRVPEARPLEAVVPERPLLTTVRVPSDEALLPSVLRPPAIPYSSRPPRLPRVRLVKALRAMVSPRGAYLPVATPTPPW